MPAYRNIPFRRSGRISQLVATNYAENKQWESFEAGPSSVRGLSNPDAFPSPTLSAATSCLLSQETPYEFPPIMGSEPLLASHPPCQPEGHIPRPANAFMIFRSAFWAREKQKEHPIERNHRNISRIASHCWNSMSAEEKAPYEALARQRKQLQLLKYPNYKYTPGNRPSKVSKKVPKKETKKANGEVEERCKKLAALVMDGLSSNDIRQEVMKDTNNKPRNRRSETHQPEPHSNCRTSNRSLPSPGVSSRTLELVRDVQPVNKSLGDGFVPTDEIPHLDLSETVVKDEEVVDLDASIRPPGYDAIDSQFGFEPTISQFNPSTLWYMSDGGASVAEDLASSSLSDDSLLSTGELKNPFEYMVTSDWNRVFDQDLDSASRHIPPAMIDDIDILFTRDAEMSQYLHFAKHYIPHTDLLHM